MGEYLLLIALLLALFTNCPTAETQQKIPSITGPEDPHLPQIIVTSQPDSPLQITTLTKWAIPTREMLDLYVTVKNQDAKSVRAYTTRIDVDQQGRKEICLIENIYFPDKVIKQDGGIGRSRFLRVEKNILPPSIEVSIDYVEFADGSAWGQDRCQAVEYLAGERAGGEAAIKWFQNLIKEKGTQAVVEIIRSGGVTVEKPYNPSARWDDAFKHGVQIVGDRITMAYQTEGESEVAVVLSKPFDASGVR